jgi:hypothetical protein
LDREREPIEKKREYNLLYYLQEEEEEEEEEIVASVVAGLVLRWLYQDGATPSISTLRFLFDWERKNPTRDLSTSFFVLSLTREEKITNSLSSAVFNTHTHTTDKIEKF